MNDQDALRWLSERKAFVVLGVMKGGTSSLRAHFQAYAWQDNLSIPSCELHFFDDDDQHAHGAAHYVWWFQWDENSPEPEFIGDITPSYIYIPEAIPRLYKMLPKAKLIVLLRNPIERMVSHHNHDLDKGRDVGSLTERIARERSRLGRARPSRMDMLARGFYHAHLEKVLSIYPRDQLLVVISERYRSNTKVELSRIRAFIGLHPLSDESEEFEERHVRGKYSEMLMPEDRVRCRNLYADDVAKLRILLNDDIPEWKDFV